MDVNGLTHTLVIIVLGIVICFLCHEFEIRGLRRRIEELESEEVHVLDSDT